MSFEITYSREFLEKVSKWPGPLQDMAFQAAEHAALNPTLNEYNRTENSPYKQKHPTRDRQYTLYFLIDPPNQKQIFVVWINDDTCLHDTRSNHQDPCKKEFLRRKNGGLLETYDPDKHQVKFQVNPNFTNPTLMCRSTYLGHKIQVNSHRIGNDIIGYSFSCNEPNTDIAIRHLKQFLIKLHGSLENNASGANYQLELDKASFPLEIKLLVHSFDQNQWDVVPDQNDFILRKK